MKEIYGMKTLGWVPTFQGLAAGGIDTLIATSMFIDESKSKLPVINKSNESYHPKTQHVFFTIDEEEIAPRNRMH